IPGMKVFCPADDEELGAALPVLMADPAPCYIRFTSQTAVVEHPRPGEPFRAEVIAESTDGPVEVCMLSHGLGLAQAVDAHARLAARGVRARVVKVRMPKPLDTKTVLGAMRDARLVVIVEDHLRAGGLFSILSSLLVERGLRARVLPLDLGDAWFHPAMLA